MPEPITEKKKPKVQPKVMIDDRGEETEKPKIPNVGQIISKTTTGALGGVSSVLNMGKNAVLGGVSKIPIPKIKF